MMMVAGILISITILTGVTVYLFIRYRHRFREMKHQQSSNYYSETGGGGVRSFKSAVSRGQWW